MKFDPLTKKLLMVAAAAWILSMLETKPAPKKYDRAADTGSSTDGAWV